MAEVGAEHLKETVTEIYELFYSRGVTLLPGESVRFLSTGTILGKQ